MEPTPRLRIGKLILVPALVSLCITFLRLAGELRDWSPTWFSKETSGPIPTGFSWVIGITWLALPFGAWFAWKLGEAGIKPARPGRALVLALVSTALFYSLPDLLFSVTPLSFPLSLLPIWAGSLIAVFVAWYAWPALAKVLAAYGLAARLPVALVMFLAMHGKWGTHYDYTGMPAQFQMPFWKGFFWLAFFPQLIFWVGYTVMIGVVAGSLVSVIRGRLRLT